MSLPLVIKEEAIQDMVDAFEWYEKQRPNLGVEFLDEVDTCFAKVAAYPNRFPIYQGFRMALTNRFPYKIVFEREADTVIVYAVYHDKRNPILLSERRKI
jgi:plasmid stabilization system protein ParE